MPPSPAQRGGVPRTLILHPVLRLLLQSSSYYCCCSCYCSSSYYYCYHYYLWGDGFVGGGANGLFHRFCAEAAASDVGKVEAARKIRLHLAELIRRYHSKVVPGLARGSVAATPWVR